MIFKRLLFLVSFLIPTNARAEIVSAMSASSGVVLTNVQGYKPASETLTKNFDARWLSFRSRTFAGVGEFQVAFQNELNLTQVMETRIGLQYYPFAFGADFEDFHENVTMRYTASLKPYMNLKVGYGRYLITIVQSLGAAEVSSNYVSVGGGLGFHYHLTRSFALDVLADAAFAVGTSEVAFTGLYIRPRVGLMVYL